MAPQKIMRDLGRHRERIAGAIAHEDWEAVRASANAIAAHPQPPLAEKMRIPGFVGSNANRFRDHDVRTRATAGVLQEGSVRADGEWAIKAYADLRRSCRACHQQFRPTFVQHFPAGGAQRR